MKIRGFIVTGVLFAAVGAGITGYAASRDDFNYEEIQNVNVELEEKSYSAAEVDRIYLSASADSFKIIETDTDEIKITGKKTNYMSYTYTLEDKELTIQQEYEEKWYFRIFPFNLYQLWAEADTSYTIAIPKNAIAELHLEIHAGNIMIEHQELTRMVLDVNAGNVEILDTTIKEADIQVNAGNIKLTALTAEELQLIVNAGNVNANGRIIKSANFEVNAGNIDLELTGTEQDYCVNGKGNGAAVITGNADVGHFGYKYIE